ncbi:MAG: gliding motility-associated C-terminal domain-containing protein [Xanthomarina gelatinilytica]|uniref:T9SS type B sorting domain-containing protein n=1 Tax=Xanthomarina gelatinilytica TaxID=1137281 RepID=UPI003A87B340
MKKITLSLLFGFISLIGFSQIGLVENFDAGLTLPPGWTGSGYSGSVFQPCSVVSLRANLSDSNLTDDLISPNIVGQSNGTDLTVAFDYKIVDWSAAVDPTPPGWGELNVQYSTNNGSTWTTFGTINDVNHQASNTCANMSFVVPAASVPIGTNVKLRFENNYFSGNYYFYIDNVTASQVVVDPPSCSNLLSPTNGETGVAITANLSWQAATGIPTGYTLSVGTTPGGTEIVDNLNVGLSTSYDLPELEYSTTYYVTITPFNDNGPAVGCVEQSFTTGADPNAPVDCGNGIPINTVFCYTNNDNTTFSFVSSDGSPLVVVFNSGSTENNWDELIVLDSDGTTNLNATTPYGNAGNLAGLMFTSSGDTITVGVTSDGSGISCTSNPWNFDVFCLDTTALPNCDADLTQPLNGAIDVSENTDLTWSAATVFVTGYTLYMGTTPGGTDVLNGVDVGDVLTYNLPTNLDYETTYYVTIVPYNDNGPATNCNEQSFTTRLDPNQIIDCAAGQVLNTVFCYENGIPMWTEIYSFQSSDGSPLNLFFNSGTIETCCDTLRLEEGDGTLIYQGTGNAGNFAGMSFISTTDRIVMFYEADSSVSCSSGSRVEWDFDVSCVDTTAVPNCNASLTTPLNGAIGVDENSDLTWRPATVLVTGYILYVGTTPGGTDVLNGVDVGNVLTYDPGTLAYETTYYVTIVPYNDNGPATGCTEESFTVKADPNQVVDCDTAEVINTVHCYENNEITEWWFAASTGGPLSLFFNAGFLEESASSGNTWDDLFIYDGTDNTGTLLFDSNDGIVGNSDLTGLSLVANSGNLYLFFDADGGGSCSSNGYAPLDFDVTCVDETALPNCNASLTDPLNGAVDVDENSDLTWRPATVLVTGYILYVGTTPGGTDVLDGVDVGNVLTYDLGTLAYETTYYVTIVPYNDNGSATNCTEESFTTRLDPNQIIDCEAGEVLNTVHCYENGDNTYQELYSFQSSSGFPLNISFNSGTIETCCDTIRIEEGDGTVIYQGTGNAGDLTGLTFTSVTNRIVVFAEADGSVSCDSGSREPWDFDVWCQTCMPQTVSFDVVNGDCITDPNNPVFDVQVDITDMGDAASLTITDNQGSPAQVVTETGVLIFGPYPANTNVIVTAENTDDANCTIISNPLAFLCPPPPNPCSIVYAGEDTSVDCNTPDAVLSANFHLYGQDTNNYEINAIDTCPTPPVDGATPTSIDVDDTWSEVIDLGFDFCFYGGVYNQVIIGSNGVVSFEIENATSYNEWDLQPFGSSPSSLPNATNTTITEANIFGVSHDIDPSVCGSIDYVVLGSAPYRQFVVNYNAVCHFGSQCNSNTSTSQIILHESSNNIDIHVLSKPTCMGWNDGLAVIGLQNVDDTQATTPPGRNTGVWTVTEPESWRFSPSGTPNYTLEWTDDNGTIIGTEDTVTVSPTQTTTYTFAVTYDLCTGGQATVSDDVEVVYTNLSTYDASFEITPDCTGATANILGDTGGEFTFNPVPTDGAIIDTNTGEITNGVPGTTYTVQYTVGEVSCPAINTVDVTILTSGDPSFTMTADCTGATATITGTTGGTFTFNPEPGDGAMIDVTTGEITNGVPGTTYTVEYTTPGSCGISNTVNITILDADDASFTLTANCTGATATIIGDTGGTFVFNPVPTDGAMIDVTTGEITNGVTGATYTVEYTTTGSCPATSSQTITIPALEDASFTLTPTCDGAIATITGDTGGTFAFNPMPADGALIDATTGEITNGVPGTMYTVEYTTGGACSASSSQTVTVLPAEDASFSMTPTCSGATAVVTGDTGGTFTFNPSPEDGAMIDTATGEITNGTPEETYTVEYITSGPCPATAILTVSLLASPEDASFNIVSTTCDGATVEITGDTGGVFALNPAPLGDAVINPVTGEITGGASNTNYTIEYTTSGPCPVTTSETFTTDTCVIPQVITPNGDGVNDSFDLSGFDVSSLEIFNRNGIKVYSRNNYSNEFIGLSDNGDELPTGTYFYVMRYKQNEERSAWIYINREK